MCPMEQIASCEISFIPIISEDYVRSVDKVLNIIKSSGLEYSIGILSTTIRGNKEHILKLILEIYNLLDKDCKFVIDIKISNLCGCN